MENIVESKINNLKDYINKLLDEGEYYLERNYEKAFRKWYKSFETIIKE